MHDRANALCAAISAAPPSHPDYPGNGSQAVTDRLNAPASGRETLWVGLAGLLLFTLGIWHQPFVNFETRFALFAEEMWRHGPSLFPTTYGAPYPDYPGTSTFMIWLLAHLFGGVTKLAAVLPTAIAASITLALSYRLCGRFSRQWALLTVCFELLTVTFLNEARSISLDQMVTMVATAGFYVAYTASVDGRPRRLWWLPALLIFGFAVRGPLGIVLPAGVVCSYYLLSRQWRALIVFGFVAAALLAGCWLTLLGLAHLLYGADFVKSVVHMEVAGRVDSTAYRPYLYYLTSSFGNYALSYPIAVAAVVLGWKALRPGPDGRDRHTLLLYLAGWAAIVLIGMSVPTTKKIRYVLPMIPALSALAAYALVDTRERGLRWLSYVVQGLWLCLPGLLLVALQVAARRLHHGYPHIHLPILATTVLLAILQLIALVIFLRRRGPRRRLGLAVTAVAVIWSTNLLVIAPAMEQLHNTSIFVSRTESLRAARPGALMFFRIGRDANAIKYMVNLNADEQPLFARDPSAIAGLTGPTYIVVPERDAPALLSAPRLSGSKPVLQGRFDNTPYEVFFLPAPSSGG